MDKYVNHDGTLKDLEDVETRENDWDIELWMIRKIDIPVGLEEVVE